MVDAPAPLHLAEMEHDFRYEEVSKAFGITGIYVSQGLLTGLVLAYHLYPVWGVRTQYGGSGIWKK